MRILLVGDYSNVHATLARGLRLLGHDVVLASDGDGWKNYPRDVDLRRASLRKWDTAKYLLLLERTVRTLRGFDVVQLIGPDFLPLKAGRIGRYYKMLRQHNGRLFLGAFGMDKYYVEACLDCRTFRYSDFNFGNSLRESAENRQFIADWHLGAKGRLNELIADECDGIVAGLYEYYASYAPHFSHKLRFIPFPIVPNDAIACPYKVDAPIRFFIGLMRGRMAYKGTDVMLRALQRVKQRFGDAVEIESVENVPFAEYQRLLTHSHVLLDQLYSYTPAMNALEAMAHGMVVVGGGEEENYQILHEETLRPIVNVQPDEESVYEALCVLVEDRGALSARQEASREYVVKHHDYRKVAQQYVDFWNK